MNNCSHTLSIAPMIDWSNTFFRVFMRILSKYALLYTEMQTLGSIFHNQQKSLAYYSYEQPLALQVGGAVPEDLKKVAQIAKDQGFIEINLNVGCPSSRVQSGHMGACLMLDGVLVSECIAAMRSVGGIAVTAKTRIGVDHHDSYDFFSDFAHMLVAAKVDKLIIHARKAWLKGLSPKQNRTIPPINYEYVYNLKKTLPSVPIVINGEIRELESIKEHLQIVDGVMLGRLACDNPYKIATISAKLFGSNLISRAEALELYFDKVNLAKDNLLSIKIKPIINLANGLPGAKQWRQAIVEALKNKDIAYFACLSSKLEQMEHAGKHHQDLHKTL